ncbi:MAG: hypothetical protein KC635_08585, partial [Myxococcales bacterium]|nr:hypothetical protein [Myxococcales bacterium]
MQHPRSIAAAAVMVGACLLSLGGGGCSALISSAGKNPDGTQRLPRTTDVAAYRDAVSDRGLIAAHAETPGIDDAKVDLQELVFMGVGYAPTRDTEANVAVLLPLDPATTVATLGGKYVAARTDRVLVAVRADAFYVRSGSTKDALRGVSGGLLVDAYLDPGGYVGVFLGASAGTFAGTLDLGRGEVFDPGAVGLAQVGLTAALGDGPLSLLAEGFLLFGKVDGRFRAARVAL